MNLRSVVSAVIMCVASIAGAQTGPVITAISGERDSDGSVSVSGKISLPAGTRLRVSIEQSHTIVIASVNSKGEFTARGIGRTGRPILDTSLTVRIEATIGRFDQEHIAEAKARMTVAPISDNASVKLLAAWRRDSLEFTGRPIVEAVRNAVIQLPDGRTSSVPVGNAVHWNEWMGKFKPGIWSVQQPAPDEWIVTLGSSDRKDSSKAQWSHNTATKETRPLNALATLLSYRSVPLLACVTAAESLLATFSGNGFAKPPTVMQLFILPLPAPPVDAWYDLRAVFLVDPKGNAELLEWTRPNDAEYAKKALATLTSNTFRPAMDHDGAATCGRARIRVSLDPTTRR